MSSPAEVVAEDSAEPVAAPVPEVPLTEEESQWLREHPTIILGVDPHWAPFSLINEEGELEGIDNDYLKLIGERLGVSFELRKTSDWKETYQAVLDDELDIVSGVGRSPEREEKLLFSPPYLSSPTALVTRLDGPFFSDLDNFKRAKLASPRGYITTERIKEDYPEIQVIETSTVDEALRMVSGGEADFTFGNLASQSQIIRDSGLTNLKISGLGDFNFELHFGVRRDLPLLHSAITKALATISAKERAKILADWIYIPNETPNPFIQHRNKIMFGGILVAMGVVLFIFWNRRLARELVERRRIEEELLKLNEEKSRFMSMAAHDINNPLTIIDMNCQLATSGSRIGDDRSDEHFKDIQKHARRISQLINSLLTTNPVEAGPGEPMVPVADLQDIAGNVLDRYTHSAQAKDITIHWIPPEREMLVRADPDRAMQVIENLVSNAVKFSPPQGEITLTSQVVGDSARLEIVDTGPGISEQDRPRLFGWFSRLSALPTGKEASHGLGLFIVKQLMDEMKGKVWEEGRPGEGARFIVEFPLMDPEMS
ncbi:MAG: transporter substrate-binding domain-containing protein [Luteolibacter sp.]